MYYAFVLNPVAGNGFAEKSMQEAELWMKEQRIEYQVFRTERPGHAAELAANLSRDPEVKAVVSFGGDGTASEVAGALAETGKPMGLIPAGTGNDFVKCIHLPLKPMEALRFLVEHDPRPIDIGTINNRFFLNVCGTGFDVDVLDNAESLKKKYRGLTPYLLGLLKAIAHYRPVHLKINKDGEKLEGEFLILALANGKYFGGGIPICPAADAGDGKLDFVLIRNVSRWLIPFYLPGLMMGKDLKFRVTTHLTAERVEIDCPGMRVDVDGEILSMDHAVFTVRAAALQLIC